MTAGFRSTVPCVLLGALLAGVGCTGVIGDARTSDAGAAGPEASTSGPRALAPTS